MERADCSAPLQPSRGASVDEYECVQNETSYETTNYNAFLPLCNLHTFKRPVIAPNWLSWVGRYDYMHCAQLVELSWALWSRFKTIHITFFGCACISKVCPIHLGVAFKQDFNVWIVSEIVFFLFIFTSCAVASERIWKWGYRCGAKVGAPKNFGRPPPLFWI